MTLCCECGCWGVSLGDERFCANCLRIIGAQFDVGYALLLDFLEKHAQFEAFLRQAGKV